MDLSQELKKNQELIINKWFEATIRTYPEETAKILIKLKNRFDNPVGSATRQSLEDSFSHLIKDNLDANDLENSLDSVIRIRAVQNFTAYQAVSFVFELKNIVKDVIKGDLGDDFHFKIDQMALAAFNRFMKCRESIFLLKATEAKKRIHRSFERAGLVAELSEDELIGSNKS